jgi:glycosyltransferase involved in cell wall biosynthesis
LKNNKPKIAVINIPLTVKSGNIPLSNLLDILLANSSKLYLVSGKIDMDFLKGKNINLYTINHSKCSNVLLRVFKYIYAQLKISFVLLSKLRNIEMFFFFIGGEQLILPILTAKILRKKIVLILAGNPSKVSAVNEDPFSGIIELLSKINMRFVDRIIVYSNSVIQERNLKKFESKIIIASEHIIDFNIFYIKKNLKDRKNVIGFFGDLGNLKGVMNLLFAIPEILNHRKDLLFLIGGEGVLKEKIESYIIENELYENVKLTGWIQHKDIPQYLSQLKLLVLPSYTEGLPNIIIEAMACGTPVIATAVGAIPDIIIDKKTGFIMENNTPTSISDAILRALNDPELDEISKSSHLLVVNKFTYNKQINRYNKIITDMGL